MVAIHKMDYDIRVSLVDVHAERVVGRSFQDRREGENAASDREPSDGTRCDVCASIFSRLSYARALSRLILSFSLLLITVIIPSN